MRNAQSRLAWMRRALAGGLALVAGLPLMGRSAEPIPSQTLRTNTPGSSLPIVRQAHYLVNARVRPLAVFWIGRDNVGDARFTWREGPGDRRAFELLVGSDPARTPRQINRWGFIAEEVHARNADILGFMKGSTEETIDDAEANAERDGRSGSTSTFRAVRTTVTGNRAVTGTLSFQAPPDLTYRQLDALLGLMPDAPKASDRKVIDLPAGAKEGFLIAMTSMIAASTAACRESRTHGVEPVIYLYKQSLYDLRLESCRFETQLRTKAGPYPDVVDGQFEIRNRATGDRQNLRIAYGTAGLLRDVPVRIVFRPRWWMEAELLLDRSAGSQK
jgi:hypothetical protein